MFELKITGASFEELRDQAAQLFGFSTCEESKTCSSDTNTVSPVIASTNPVTPIVSASATPIPVNSPAPVQVPTTPTSYTQDQLAYAAAALMETGKQDALIALLGQFGVQALTQLPVEQYGAFALKLRELGATL